ncbi:MAG: hypothetical protein NTY53_07890 [Kiritimatiellaeota bacterium]|nr:hypothetical protein [Kiritimatiellota bacterium]
MEALLGPLLEHLQSNDAAELLLTGGEGPRLRLHGALRPVGTAELKPEEATRLAESLMTPAQRESFLKHNALAVLRTDRNGRLYGINIRRQGHIMALAIRRIADDTIPAATLHIYVYVSFLLAGPLIALLEVYLVKEPLLSLLMTFVIYGSALWLCYAAHRLAPNLKAALQPAGTLRAAELDDAPRLDLPFFAGTSPIYLAPWTAYELSAYSLAATGAQDAPHRTAPPEHLYFLVMACTFLFLFIGLTVLPHAASHEPKSKPPATPQHVPMHPLP